MSGTEERLWAIIEPYLAKEGIELDDVEVVGTGGASIVRVTIDGDGVDIDLIARVSRGVSRMLDEDDPIAASYTLEVSSPGLERRLRRPRHYQKAIGRDVKIKTRPNIEGDQHHRGVLTAAAEDSAVIETEGGLRTIAYRDITSARTLFVWDAKAKPGAAKH